MGIDVSLPECYSIYFKLIIDNPDIFPGFFLIDVKNNVRPKLEILRKFGFYSSLKGEPEKVDAESCGAHSPHIADNKKESVLDGAVSN